MAIKCIFILQKLFMITQRLNSEILFKKSIQSLRAY